MRTLFALLTLGAGGAGYIYLQQPPAPGEPYSGSSIASSTTHFDWNSLSPSKSEASRVPAKELVSQIHERTRSVLDRFTSQYGGHSDAPNDDAFQRLHQATRSIVVAAAKTSEPSTRPADEFAKPSRLVLPNFGELQRTAFDPSQEELPSKSIPNISSSLESTDRDSEPLITPFAPADQQESTASSTSNDASRSELIETTNNVPRSEKNVSRSKTEVDNATLQPTIMKKSIVAKRAAAEWKVVGKTTEGRPMHSMHLGEVGTRILVIAGLNGEDRTAVRWLELLADEMKQRTDLVENNEIVFYRAGNPDGLVRNTRNNSRGVPLNRNFPSRRYRPNFDVPQFAVPAGEVETRVMLDTLYSFRPRRLIHLTSTGGKSSVLYNRSAKSLASELERSAKLGIQPFDNEQFPGSIEDFADGTLEAAVLSMRLGVGNDWQKSWASLKPHLVAAVVGQPIEVIRGDAAQPSDPDRSPIPHVNAEAVSRVPRKRGYEELPPPPK